MLQIKFLIARTEWSHPNTGAETESPNVLGEFFHAFRKLGLIGLEIHIVELRDWQLVRISLPRFNRPDFATERLKEFFPDASFREIVFGGGLVEVGIPRHPACRGLRASLPVERFVVWDISVF